MNGFCRRPQYAYMQEFLVEDQDRGVDPIRVTIDFGDNGIITLNQNFVGKWSFLFIMQL